MGNVAAILDCAANPLNPLPEESAAEITAKAIPLELEVPLRNSSLWKLQREFYLKYGLEAWTKGIVPNFVANNAYVAKAYARVIAGVVTDVFALNPLNTRDMPVSKARRKLPDVLKARNPASNYSEPVYVIEVGAGAGQLAFSILESLARYQFFLPERAGGAGGAGEGGSAAAGRGDGVAAGLVAGFKYVLTDASPSIVEALKKKPELQAYVQQGLLDFAVFDCERDHQVRMGWDGMG